MISQLTTAGIRAALVVVAIATPALILPDVSVGVTQVLALIAIFAGGFVFLEYSSNYPGLIEFRDAAPFNRVRFCMAFFMLFAMAAALRGSMYESSVSDFFYSIGILLGLAIDFPFSPVRVLLDTMPAGSSFEHRVEMRMLAGLAYISALVAITIFAISIRLRDWPLRNEAFNVWINLPTFDPTAGGDVVLRMQRDAKINIALGIVLPYVTPLIVSVIGGLYDVSLLNNPHTLVWAMALWAFLPASSFMRGIALYRISAMLLAKREKLVSTLAPEEFKQPLIGGSPGAALARRWPNRIHGQSAE